jgi:hypothetical protein
MANVYATKAGNWSDPTVWNTGALPTSSDDVFSNNFIVQVDVSATVLSVRNGASAPVVAGGSFNLLNGVTLSATESTTGFVAGASNLITVASSAQATIVGRCYHGNFGGSVVTLSNATSILNVIGDIRGAGYNPAINISAGTLNITGNALGFYVNASYTSPAITVTGGTLNLVGSVFGSVQNIGGGQGALYSNGGTVNITGNLSVGTALTAAGYALVNVGASTITVNGSVTAGNHVAIFNTASTSTMFLSGPFINNGEVSAVMSVSMLLQSNSVTWDTFLLDGDGLPTVLNRLYNLGEDPAFPDEEDVRQGTDYGVEDTLTGTMIVPPASSVAKDVPVDATVGTADVTAADIWNHPLASITTAGSIGERLKNAATVQTVAEQVAALT